MQGRIADGNGSAGTLERSSITGTPQADLRKNPILISTKTSAAVRANLIGPHPEDQDAIIVEMDGVRRTIKLDEVAIVQQARKFDDYGNIAFNDEKARLDNFAIELQNMPDSQAYLVASGSCAGQAKFRTDRITDYLVNSRGIDRGRISSVQGGCKSNLTIQLWYAPAGAIPPVAPTEGTVSCPECGNTKPKPSKVQKMTRKSTNRGR